ncbi:MAG: flagellar biosynthetic protein FliR [Pseudomonadota bacterium]
MDVEPIIAFFIDSGAGKIFRVMVVTFARPLGLLFGFYLFAWVFRAAITLRISIAAAISLPVLVVNIDALEVIAAGRVSLSLVPLVGKEFLIGYAFGFLGSLPFLVVIFAGAMIDGMRGEGNSGHTEPIGGDMMSTSSSMFLVIAAFAFMSFDGLWRLVADFYVSYDIWPIGAFFPVIADDAVGTVLTIFGDILLSAATVALPMLLLFASVELILGIASRLSERFTPYQLAFPLRNLLYILSLPVVAWGIWEMSGDITADSMGLSSLLQQILLMR